MRQNVACITLITHGFCISLLALLWHFMSVTMKYLFSYFQVASRFYRTNCYGTGAFIFSFNPNVHMLTRCSLKNKGRVKRAQMQC